MGSRSMLHGGTFLSSLLPPCKDLLGRNREEIKVSFQPLCCCSQELLPRGLDIKQEELGDLVDKEMAATSAAIETATARIEVWKHLPHLLKRGSCSFH